MEIVSGKTAAFSRINRIVGKGHENLLYPPESSLRSQKPLLELSLGTESATTAKATKDQALIDKQIEKHLRIVPRYMKVKHMVIWGKKTFLRGYYWTKRRKTLRTEFVMCGRLNYYRSRGLDVPAFKRVHEELPAIVEGKTFSMLFRFDKESIRNSVAATHTVSTSEIDFVGKDMSFAIFSAQAKREKGKKDESAENRDTFFEIINAVARTAQNHLKLLSAATIKSEVWVDLASIEEEHEGKVVAEKTIPNSQNIVFSPWYSNATSSQGFTLLESASASHRIEIDECLEAPEGIQKFVFSNLHHSIKPTSAKATIEDNGKEVGYCTVHTISTIIGRSSIAKPVKILSPKIYFTDDKSDSVVGLKIQAVTAPEDGDSKERNIDWARLIASSELSQHDFVN